MHKRQQVPLLKPSLHWPLVRVLCVPRRRPARVPRRTGLHGQGLPVRPRPRLLHFRTADELCSETGSLRRLKLFFWMLSSLSSSFEKCSGRSRAIEGNGTDARQGSGFHFMLNSNLWVTPFSSWVLPVLNCNIHFRVDEEGRFDSVPTENGRCLANR